MKSQTPILIFHQDINFVKNYYISYVVKQAQFYNPANNIVLIGNIHSSLFSSIETVNPDSLTSSRSKEFKTKYIHLSTNTFEFEYLCFKRWFLILEYMKKNNLKFVYVIDSDFLLFSNLDQYQKKFFNEKSAFVVPNRENHEEERSTSAHCSFWNIEHLEQFCNFIIKTYSEKKYLDYYQNLNSIHTKNNRLGGVCDMTTLYLFYQKNKEDIVNLLEIKDNCVFDLNVNVSENLDEDEFQMKGKYKKIIIQRKDAFFVSLKKKKNIKALGIHFQGSAKVSIKNYYLGKKFKYQILFQFISFLHGIRSCLKKLKIDLLRKQEN